MIDGTLRDWPRMKLATSRQPIVLGATNNQWNGTDDASLSFSVSRDKWHLYVAARVRDDHLLPGDALEIRLDPRPMAARLSDRRLRRDTHLFRIPAESAGTKPEAGAKPKANASRNPETRMATRRTERGYDAELAIPIALFAKVAGRRWRDFQLTVAVVDVDAANANPCRVLWRGTPEWDQRNTRYGVFVRK